MVAGQEADEGPHQRRGIIQGMKKMAVKSAQGTKKALKTTKEAVSPGRKNGKAHESTPLLPSTNNKDPSETREDSSPTSSDHNTVTGEGSVNMSVRTTETTKAIIVGPLMEFLTADATLLMVAAFAVATVPTIMYHQAILENQIPVTVAGSWILLTYTMAQVFSAERWKASQQVFIPSSAAELEASKQQSIPGEIGIVRPRKTVVHPKKTTSHKVFFRLLGPKQREKISFGRVGKTVQRGRKAWTTLQSNRKVTHPWEKRLDPTKDTGAKKSKLMKRLLRNKKLRRTSMVASSPIPVPEEDEATLSSALGAIGSTPADTLEDIVIEPLLKLRGMDVFLSDELETSVGSHPWLISQGLRDIPTIVVNTATPWGNILVYFEMPDWVKDFDPYDEEDSDPDDVKAFKRFLNGDQKYRNERLKVIPSIVEGPLAVKVLAPPKEERLLNCAFLPVVWQQYDQEITSTGRKLCAALEVTLDCFSVRAMRSISGMVKRNLKRLSIDIAAVIGKPDGQEEDELEACLGLWRMDHIDISACPQMPDRFSAEGQDPDVVRASKLVGMSPSELKELTAANNASLLDDVGPLYERGRQMYPG